MVPRDPAGAAGAVDEYALHHQARGWLAELFEELCTWASPPSPGSRGGPWPGGSTGAGLRHGDRLGTGALRARSSTSAVAYMVTVPMLRSMPPKKALELMLTSRGGGCRGGHRIGFRDPGGGRGLAGRRVRAMALLLASKPRGDEAGPRIVLPVLDSAATEALPYLHSMLTVTSQTAEAAEGIAAFAEKRPPAWQQAATPTSTDDRGAHAWRNEH